MVRARRGANLDSGWKPPWNLVEYIIRKLPKGGGKPAFILYTYMGGAENAGFIAWLLLKLKGYRVIGRNWAAYPNNVVTLRPGPKRLWRCLDRIFPTGRDIAFIRDSGEGHPR